MKILEISLFHPELVRGGAQQAAYELFLGMRRAGLDATLLASADLSGPKALFKPGAIITGFDGRKNEFLFLSDAFDHVWLRNLNIRALHWFEEFLRDRNPDIVHFHHFLTFGLELFLIARRALPKARLFLTLHEFLAICRADGHMLRTFDKTLCTEASSVRCHQCFPDTTPEMFRLREDWIKQALGVFDGFIAPTEFVRERYVAWGLPARKVHVVTNAQSDYSKLDSWRLRPPSPADRTRRHNRFAFFGQLVDVKGLGVVFEALDIFAKRYEEALTFEINGSNLKFASEKFRGQFEDFVSGKHGLPERIKVTYNGSYAMTDLPARMARIDWVLVPSIWWEIFGLVLSEAFMFRRPPIASRIGGLAERVQNEKNGLLFDAGDADELADIFYRAITEEGLWKRLSAASPGVPSVESVVQAHLKVFAGGPPGAARRARAA
ncbi:MAG TPA: glycosyltransferase [Acetobacteraceae bacterium]|nr:glycosyltransferase [Acetobacteraceae bacterium]